MPSPFRLVNLLEGYAFYAFYALGVLFSVSVEGVVVWLCVRRIGCVVNDFGAFCQSRNF
jgi:hypothetical protein